MGEIFLTSDYHFNHDKDFIWKARSFNSVQEMNEEIIRRHNEVVHPNDNVFILGDLCLGGGSPERLEINKQLIERLNGKLYIVRGNHDTEQRVKMYKSCKNVQDIDYAMAMDYKKYHFYLSHYPTLTGNVQRESLKQMTLNLFGHTHQMTNFFENKFYMYHVGVDSHECYPVSIEDIIIEIEENFKFFNAP